MFRGQPVGGSVGQTSLNVAAGARTRWAAIFSGLWMLVILAAFSGVVGEVAMPVIAVVTTFVATLFLPVAAAVGIGVALSLLLQLNQEAMDLAVVELVPTERGGFDEQRAPATLTSHHVTVLDVYGSLFYAGARTRQVRLPDPTGTQGAAVVLRLHGRTSLGATFFKVIADYAQRLSAAGGTLCLSGVDGALAQRMQRAGRVGLSGPVRVYDATAHLHASTTAALADAEAWVIRHRDDEET